jgi:alpha-glucosidase (family GH31 glycosyl hydrolase)
VIPLPQAFVASLHRKDMKYVMIVDPGIKIDKGYPAYDRGLKADIFIKDVTGKSYVGQVCSTPASLHYPSHPSIILRTPSLKFLFFLETETL